jgi:alkanesulfonate monooxygenase SsuD/methylene tetrahydromethanopterin reductase-like flavin-dependent oxidoreductase (luciferase family)
MTCETGLRFGVFLPPLPSWPAIRDRARLIEDLGFDSIWMPDHFANPFDTSVDWMETWTLLAGIAACTQRVQVGTLVSTFMHRHPAMLAKQAVTLDHLSNGRAVLGLGAGSKNDPAHWMGGLPAWSTPERMKRFEEGLQLAEQMMRHEESSFHGEYYRVDEAVVRPGSVQKPRPPLLVGGSGRRMLGLAARYADNWNRIGSLAHTQQETLARAAEDAQLLAAEARAAGRHPDEIRRSFCMGWTTDDIYCSVSAFQDHIYPLIQVGVSEFMLGFWKEEDIGKPSPIRHVGDEAMLERIASVAVPSLRSLARAPA